MGLFVQVLIFITYSISAVSGACRFAGWYECPDGIYCCPVGTICSGAVCLNAAVVVVPVLIVVAIIIAVIVIIIRRRSQNA